MFGFSVPVIHEVLNQVFEDLISPFIALKASIQKSTQRADVTEHKACCAFRGIPLIL